MLDTTKFTEASQYPIVGVTDKYDSENFDC